MKKKRNSPKLIKIRQLKDLFIVYSPDKKLSADSGHCHSYCHQLAIGKHLPPNQRKTLAPFWSSGVDNA